MTTSPEASSPKWKLKSPQNLPEDSPSFLCDVCKHINFKFLIFECSVFEGYNEVPLDSYSKISEKQYCAFCRLVKKTIDNNYGAGIMPVEHEGKPIMISMIASLDAEALDLSSSRQLALWIKPDLLKNGTTPTLNIHTVREGSWVDSEAQGNCRVIPSQIDFLLALYWNRWCRNGLSALHKDHGPEKEDFHLPDGFRLIDVEKKCIVPADPSFEYITLSYVWGKGEALRLVNANHAELERENSLLKYEDQIPQTIKDAMYLVERLADRYLWVDALCIIQDNPADKQSQISVMDQIYGSSILTIAAAHGDRADAGLPGVRQGTRSITQGVETIQGICLANRPWSFDKSVGESKWNTRAWTFQERILTKRTLFITQQQMFFKCDHAVECLAEDLVRKLKPRMKATYPMDDTGRDMIPQKWSINIVSYQKTVEAFVTRDITYPGDVLNAFEGIAQRMRSIFRSEFMYGIPQSELEYCMLWEPWGGKFTRRCDAKGDALFPSWSWAGWIGPIRYNWEEKLSRVKWQDDFGEQYTSNEYRAPYAADSEEKLSEWRKEWVEKRTGSGFRYFHHSSDPDVWFRNPTAPEAERAPRLGPQCQPKTTHLRFWAWANELKFPADWKAPEDTGGGPLWEFKLVDQNGYFTGYFRVPMEILPKLDFRNKRYDLILISRTRHSHSRKEINDVKETLKPGIRPSNMYAGDGAEEELPWSEKALEDYDDEKDTTTEEHFFPDELQTKDAKWDLGFDRQRYDAYKPFCLYNFLAVEWNDGVAYRIGIGKVHIDAWAQEKDTIEWKLVTLG